MILACDNFIVPRLVIKPVYMHTTCLMRLQTYARRSVVDAHLQILLLILHLHSYQEVGGSLMVNKQLEPIFHHIALYKMYGIVIQHFIYFIFYARKFRIAQIRNYH